MCQSDQYERVNVQPQRLLPIKYKEVSRVSTNTIPSERTKGANNPETTASIWSILTFAWLSEILHIGGSRAIEQADLYCLQVYHTNYMTDQSTYTANRYRRTAHRKMTRLGTTKHYLLLHGAPKASTYRRPYLQTETHMRTYAADEPKPAVVIDSANSANSADSFNEPNLHLNRANRRSTFGACDLKSAITGSSATHMPWLAA